MRPDERKLTEVGGNYFGRPLSAEDMSDLSDALNEGQLLAILDGKQTRVTARIEGEELLVAPAARGAE